MENRKVDEKMVEMLDKLSVQEIENIKRETKDENFLKEILYTLKMVPKLK